VLWEVLMQNAFHVGQLVRIVSPSSGYEDSRTYCIICLVPPEVDGTQPVYRIKNTVGVEHLVKPSEICPASRTSVP
jgi:hypothetical protein